CMHDYGWPLTF
nr:immunoglobulin light chain junction region [Macaca mulatta]